jgi:hypothetical protein
MHQSHVGKTLGEHLVNTYDDLKRLGAEEDVAIAGGLHSIYGTNAFKHATVLPSQRGIIRGLFGERAERLAWIFSHANRPEGIEEGKLVDYKTNEPIEVSGDDMKALEMIEIVNLMDNGVKLDKYPNLSRRHEELKAMI